jgi:hypothetical protein
MEGLSVLRMCYAPQLRNAAAILIVLLVKYAGLVIAADLTFAPPRQMFVQIRCQLRRCSEVGQRGLHREVGIAKVQENATRPLVMIGLFSRGTEVPSLVEIFNFLV